MQVFKQTDLVNNSQSIAAAGVLEAFRVFEMRCDAFERSFPAGSGRRWEVRGSGDSLALLSVSDPTDEEI